VFMIFMPCDLGVRMPVLSQEIIISHATGEFMKYIEEQADTYYFKMNFSVDEESPESEKICEFEIPLLTVSKKTI